MVFDAVNDLAASSSAMLVYGLILTLVGLRHLTMPSGSLIDILTEPVFQDQLRMLLARAVGVVVTAGGLGFIGNAAEDMGIY